MSKARIKKLFEIRLNTWASARSTPLLIAFPNAKFTAPDAAHLACFVLPGDADSDDLAGENRIYAGLFQITIVIPLGIGEGQAGGIADEIAALFPLNLQLTDGAFSVFVRSPLSERPAVQEATTYELPVDFTYRAQTYS